MDELSPTEEDEEVPLKVEVINHPKPEVEDEDADEYFDIEISKEDLEEYEKDVGSS